MKTLVRHRVAFASLFVALLALFVGEGLAASGVSGGLQPLVTAVVLGVVFVVAATVFDRAMLKRTRKLGHLLRGTEVSLREPVVLDPIHVELLEIGDEVRRREKQLAENEALLLAIVEMTPAALLLMSATGTVLATNAASRALFFSDAEDVRGKTVIDLLGKAPEVLRRALSASGDELFVIEDEEGTPHTHHLTKRYFDLAGNDVVLVMMSDLSQEVTKQEVDVYKRVIRVLSHEVNNSLAPISSLMHSARVLVAGAPSAERLTRVFDTVAERAEHLTSFLDGYSRLARLPLPRKHAVIWSGLFARLADLYPGLKLGPTPTVAGWLDEKQIEQVIVNLVKNAEEAGSAPTDVELEVTSSEETGMRLVIRDRGAGMTPDVMKNALVPLFSTKEKGSGLGLPICREIVAAHGGTIRLGERAGGGLEVTVRLPPASRTNVRSLAGTTGIHTQDGVRGG